MVFWTDYVNCNVELNLRWENEVGGDMPIMTYWEDRDVY